MSQLCECTHFKFSNECIDKLCKSCCENVTCKRHHSDYSNNIIKIIYDSIDVLPVDIIKIIVYDYIRKGPQCSKCKLIKYTDEPFYYCKSCACDNLTCSKCNSGNRFSSMCNPCQIIYNNQVMGRALRLIAYATTNF